MKDFDQWLMEGYARADAQRKRAANDPAMPLEPTKTAQDEQTDDDEGVGSLIEMQAQEDLFNDPGVIYEFFREED